MGAALRTHLENPFLYRRESDAPQPQQPLPRSASVSSQSSLHPSLVRGQVPTNAEPRRTAKPLPPIPGASPATSSAFPPEIRAGPNTLNPWDSFSDDRTNTLQPSNALGGRPKSATVTSTTPATNPAGTTAPQMAHSSSASSIAMTSGVPIPSANVFDLHPFGMDFTPATPAPSISNTSFNIDFTPATPAPSISNTSFNIDFTPATPAPSISNNDTRERPTWFSPASTAMEIPSSSFLPPVSMKPHNPFENPAMSPLVTPGSDPQLGRSDPHNIFTSFSLDALAPPDNAHTLSSSFGSNSSNFGGRVPPPTFGSGDYFNSGSVIAFGSPSSSLGVPSISLGGSGGGTVPNNYVNSGSGGYAAPVSPSRNILPLSSSAVPLPVSPQPPSSKPMPLSPTSPGRPSEDEFDSFLATRITQK